MLNSILDANITKKFVRLGSRSSDERMAQYSLRNLEQTFTDTSMSHPIGREFGNKKEIEQRMSNMIHDIQIPEPSEDQIKKYLQSDWGEHLLNMYEPPFWIASYAAQLESEGKVGQWKVTGKKGKGKEQSHLTGTYYGLWKRGLDIAFIQRPESRYREVPLSKKQKKQGASNVVKIPPTQKEQEEYQGRMFAFFSALGYDKEIPLIPTGNRPLIQLKDSSAVWSMSREERQRLAKHWEEEMRRVAYNNHLNEYQSLREQYEAACEKFEAVSDEVRVESIFKCYMANVPHRGNVVC